RPVTNGDREAPAACEREAEGRLVAAALLRRAQRHGQRFRPDHAQGGTGRRRDRDHRMPRNALDGVPRDGDGLDVRRRRGAERNEEQEGEGFDHDRAVSPYLWRIRLTLSSTLTP